MSPRFDLATPELDRFRSEELSRLDRTGQRYFDYTGSGLYAASQIRRHADRLENHVFGNPHSQNPTSSASHALLEAARSEVLDYFGATEDHECVFTANATAAIKLVAESFDFAHRSRLLIGADNHNSVNGVREYARRAGARVNVAPLERPSLRLDLDVVRALLVDRDPDGGLFAFPAQSNYSGVQHPLELVAIARELGWRVLLDAAAFAPTNRLDLSRVEADFVAVSFYKMFGFPTGVGALLARRDALRELTRPWFSGGTVAVVSVAADDHRLSRGHSGFEDGSPDFLSIPAVSDGLEVLQRVGIDTVHTRVRAATSALLGGLAELRHPDGERVVELIGPEDTGLRGGTIAFNVLDADGTVIRDRTVQALAGEQGISLRSGCFCNPGAGEAARGYSRTDMAALFVRGEAPDFCDIDDHFRRTKGRGASALRASLGWGTNSEDLEVLIDFLASFRGVAERELGGPVEPLPWGPDSP